MIAARPGSGGGAVMARPLSSYLPYPSDEILRRIVRLDSRLTSGRASSSEERKSIYPEGD